MNLHPDIQVTTMMISVLNMAMEQLLFMDVEPPLWDSFGILVAVETSVRLINKLYSRNNLYIQFQVSKIIGCGMVRQNDLTFNFYLGSCNSFTQPKPRILLCFDYDHGTECHM